MLTSTSLLRLNSVTIDLLQTLKAPSTAPGPCTSEESLILLSQAPHFCARLGVVGQFLEQSTPFSNVFDLGALKSPEEHLSCFSVVPTPFERFDNGALMGDVLLSAFHVGFGFLKPPLQFSAVHSTV